MPKRVYSIAPTVFAILLAAVPALTTTGAVLASDCIDEPGQQQLTQGTHWYYHWDRPNKRKCWYREVAGTRVPETTPPAQPSDSTPTLTPTFSSLFFSLIESFVGPTSAQTSQETTAPPTMRDARIIQANPTKTLKIDDIVQQPSLPEERADQRYAPSLSRTKRDALFQNFLRWDEARRNIDEATKRDALFREFLRWDEDSRNTSDVRRSP